MTGFGAARYQDERMSVSVEVRTVNNRYLKVIINCFSTYASLEPEIERMVREQIGRGTITVAIRVDRVPSDDDFRINTVALGHYWRQLSALAKSLTADGESTRAPSIGELVSLPGIVAEDAPRATNLDADWSIIRPLLEQSLAKLQEFRVQEGRSMARDLTTQAEAIAGRLGSVVELAPQVVSDFRAKMLERVRGLLSESDVQVNDSDLIREVSVFADKADINEEITRLRCHLDQFGKFLKESDSNGRKLEFLSQEMFREINTIGSKANNVAIAHCVVDMKAAVEKMREVLQNVE